MSSEPEPSDQPPPRILVVCLGNICRSPAAEAAILDEAKRAGLDVVVDSAGTSGYHAGDDPDRRMVNAARRVGLRLRGRSRQVTTGDFGEFDLILAMDAANEQRLLTMAPPSSTAVVTRFRTYDPEGGPDHDVPDPYFGGEEGFVAVLEVCKRTAAGLVATLVADAG